MSRYKCRFNIPIGEDGISKVPDGMTFGKLKVIHRTVRCAAGNYKFKCECLCCGDIIERLLSHILNNKHGCTKCSQKARTGKGSWAFKGYEEISSTYWSSVIENANIRKIEFNISIEEAYEIFLKQDRKCALSKVDLKFKSNWKINDATASLDRIDSSKCYMKDNVQWLHKDVNTMKWNLEQNYFIDMCRKITENANK